MNIYENKHQLPEPAEKTCRDCNETKPIEKFKKVPSGSRMGICGSCQTRKRNETVAKLNAGENPEDVTTDERIQKELWKNYRKARTTQEKIRCLEALVKLRPPGQQTKLDDPGVVASLVAAMKKKKKDAASLPAVDDPIS